MIKGEIKCRDYYCLSNDNDIILFNKIIIERRF